MTVKKGFTGAPFGNKSARFEVNGIHPSRLKPGTFIQGSFGQNSALGPGRYETDAGDFSEKTLRTKSKGPNWARQYETEQLASMPHLLNREQFVNKKELSRKLGPGSYEYKQYLCEEKPRSTLGVIERLDKRFSEKGMKNNPGPGSYGIPYAAIEANERKSFGSVGLLELGPKSRSLPITGTDLAPGTYNVMNGIDLVLNKTVGNKGPYECFSLDRNKPMKTGHYAYPGLINQSYLRPPEQVSEVKTTDLLNKYDKKHKGRFFKGEARPAKPAERLSIMSQSQWPRDPLEPGPGHYAIENQPKDKFNRKPPAFLSGCARMDKLAIKFFTGNFNNVGPGRYDVQKFDDCQDKNGCRSSFKSHVDRPKSEEMKFLAERLKPHNYKDERPDFKQKAQTIC